LIFVLDQISYLGPKVSNAIISLGGKVDKDELLRRLKKAVPDYFGAVAGGVVGYGAGKRADPEKGGLYTFAGLAVGQLLQQGVKVFSNGDPSDKQIRAFFEERAKLLYLVRGKDNGRPGWHYVLIDKPKLQRFQQALKTGSFDVSHYGKIIDSGWGQSPPPDVVRRITAEFTAY
jgi:hypothetical protein